VHIANLNQSQDGGGQRLLGQASRAAPPRRLPMPCGRAMATAAPIEPRRPCTTPPTRSPCRTISTPR
jgi:hypothetical protein